MENLDKLNILTAKVNLRDHIKKWFKRIETHINSQEFNANNYIVTGGCIASLLQNEIPKDFDIYSKTHDGSEIIMIHAMKNLKFRNDMVKEIDDKYREYKTLVDGFLVTENATTLQGRLQFIHKTWGTAAEIRGTFDFLHCTPYYDVSEDKLYISQRQYNAIKQKKLIVNNPATVTEERRMKFYSRNYVDE